MEAGADALEQLQAGHGCPVTVTGLDHGDGKCVLARNHQGAHLTRQEIDHTQDRLAEYENASNWQVNCLCCDSLLDASIAEHQRAEQAEDSKADLEVYAAELRDLLERSNDQQCQGCGCAPHRETHRPDCRVAAVLQADGPARAREVLEEVQRYKRVVEAARFVDADAPDPWRSNSDAANQLRRALAALDPEPQRQPRP